ncbi:LLM class flavin-dependent oxidoreductase [Ruicaihuangia caeni]|uniref:LLM class flavin-dependent oxidoreductase n=1 Tax=Ruicaihuangia caeni TaxID=3042517 RepID=A0AAW6TD95_9MICO|nr:LLM class flavin-dependent oxidoreductase [Klugiella sp. YN-L-19]MDI2099375.1 LLM class flavin-dependent oxidoreductase [Klugiella sp. YN-L-19]
MRIGISPFGHTRDGSFAVADAAVEGGIDTFWLGEGLLEMEQFPRWSGGMEPLTWLAFLAGRYPGVRVGLGASVLPLRDVQWLAKQSSTLDNLTGGNHVLAVAPGFWRHEFEYRGVDFDRRGAIFGELLDGLIAAFAGDEYSSEHLRLAPGHRLSPRPLDGVRPQLWLAGAAGTQRKALARGLPFQARAATPAELAPTVEGWKARGGGVFGLRIAVELAELPQHAAHLSGSKIVGPAQYIADQLRAYARIGVDDVSLIPGNDDESSLRTTRALVNEVLPALGELLARDAA